MHNPSMPSSKIRKRNRDISVAVLTLIQTVAGRRGKGGKDISENSTNPGGLCNMIEVKCNYKNKYRENRVCDIICGVGEDTTEHDI